MSARGKAEERYQCQGSTPQAAERFSTGLLKSKTAPSGLLQSKRGCIYIYLRRTSEPRERERRFSPLESPHRRLHPRDSAVVRAVASAVALRDAAAGPEPAWRGGRERRRPQEGVDCDRERDGGRA